MQFAEIKVDQYYTHIDHSFSDDKYIKITKIEDKLIHIKWNSGREEVTTPIILNKVGVLCKIRNSPLWKAMYG